MEGLGALKVENQKAKRKNMLQDGMENLAEGPKGYPNPNGTMRLKSGELCLFDPEDYEIIAQQGSWWRWKIKSGVTYVGRRNPGGSILQLHRLVMNAHPNQIVLHLNGNGLDCRKQNLCFGSTRENAYSFQTKRKGTSSKYRGVYFSKGKWYARFQANGKKVYLGSHPCEEAAALAVDAAVKIHYGKFATFNIK